MTRSALAGLFLAAAAVAAPVPKGLQAKAPSLDGRWEILELNANGSDVTALNPWVWEVKGEGLVIYRRDGRALRADDPSLKTTLVRESGYAAGEVDYIRGEGGGRLVFKGLVSVADDVLTICFADPGKARPAEAKAGPTVHYLRFKRIADK